MTTDRDDMEPVPEKEAQPSDIAKAAMLVSFSTSLPLSLLYATGFRCKRSKCESSKPDVQLSDIAKAAMLVSLSSSYPSQFYSQSHVACE